MENWNAEFIRNVQGLPKFTRVLEIGCFEGMTSKYICEHMLVPGGELICVDPLADEYLVQDLNEAGRKMNKEFTFFNGQFNRFKNTTEGLPVNLIRNTFKNAFPVLAGKRFDFIYVDGDHREESVYFDALHAFKILKPGGYLLFDDYLWQSTGIKFTIDNFLKTFAGELKVIKINYQVLIQKND